MEDLYVEFRKFEAQQSVAVKHNWSAEDVLYLTLQRKSKIFK